MLLIAVDGQSRLIMIERWEDVPPPYPSHVVGPNILPRKVQDVTIDANAIVGASLEVPSDKIFDIVGVPTSVLPSDFTFDAVEFHAFYVEFWEMLT